MTDNIRYSIVIPVYNGEKTVEELADRIRKLFENLCESYEIVFVDDGSADNSWLTLSRMVGKDNRIKSIKLTGNSGQHNATFCGMSYSKGEYIVTMDDDLQHSPEDIPVLIEKMRETKSRVVIAKLVNKKQKWYRQKVSDIIRNLSELTMNKPKGIHLSSFRLIERQVVDTMLRLNWASPYIPALIFYITTHVVNAEIEHKDRKYGSSNYTILKMFRLAGKLLLFNSWAILRFSRKAKPAFTVEKIENLP